MYGFKGVFPSVGVRYNNQSLDVHAVAYFRDVVDVECGQCSVDVGKCFGMIVGINKSHRADSCGGFDAIDLPGVKIRG